MAEALARNNSSAPKDDKAASQQKPKKDVVGIALVALIGANVLAVGGMGILMQKMWNRIETLEVAGSQQTAATEVPDKLPIGKELQPQNLGILYPLESFLVNISSDQGMKYLQVQMEIELAEPQLEDEVARKKAALRDAIILLLSGRTYKQLRQPEALPQLRKDLVKAMNRILTTGHVKDVFFTQFHFN